MRIFFSEARADYATYTFSYAVYCVKESQAELPEIYARGFLPYSGDTTLKEEVFYLARSLRVDLSRFEDTSENRRVARKIAPLGVTLEAVPRRDFDGEQPAFRAFCRTYADSRFSGGSMDDERLRYIWSRETLTHVLVFRVGETPVGYVFAAMEQNTLHYWFSFFDTAYLQPYSLGKWMMWETLHWAKRQGLEYVYLGTGYTEKALYKVRDHKGLQFFDGTGWNEDVKLLAALCHADENPEPDARDLFKRRKEQPGVSNFLFQEGS